MSRSPRPSVRPSGVIGIAQNLLIHLFQFIAHSTKSRQRFLPLQFHPVIDIESNVCGYFFLSLKSWGPRSRKPSTSSSMRFCSSFEKARRMFESSSILIPGAGNPECKAPRHVQKRAAQQRLQTCIGAPRQEITKVAFLPHGTFDPVRRCYWPLWPEGREHLVGTRWRGGNHACRNGDSQRAARPI